MTSDAIDTTGTHRVPDPMRLTRTEAAFIVGFWTAFAALNVASRLLDRPDMSRLPGFASVAVVEALCWALITPVIFMLAAKLDVENRRHRQFAVLAVVGVVIAVVMAWSGSELRSALTPFGGGGSTTAGRGGRGGGPPQGGRRGGPPIWFGIVNALVLYFGVVAAAMARTYSRRYQIRREEAARREARLEGQLAEARLDALRRQLDPHFLFNTLNTVSALVERDPRGVRRMISRLSELLRHSFEGGGEPEVTLRDELVMLTRYIEIMQVRFQGRLTVETNIAEDARDGLVPTMILQPLVENAIKHGIERITGPGLIEISAAVERNGTAPELVLRVRDNGPGTGDVSPTPSRQGVGIANSAARLAQLYGAAQRLTLSTDARGGAVAEIRLPFHVQNGVHTT
jgi:two-component sensor histidine kinase